MPGSRLMTTVNRGQILVVCSLPVKAGQLFALAFNTAKIVCNTVNLSANAQISQYFLNFVLKILNRIIIHKGKIGHSDAFPDILFIGIVRFHFALLVFNECEI